MVEKEVLGGGEITANVRALPNAPQVVKVVGRVPQATGIAIEKTVDASVPAVTTDRAIEQPLILVTKGALSAAVAKVIEAARLSCCRDEAKLIEPIDVEAAEDQTADKEPVVGTGQRELFASWSARKI